MHEHMIEASGVTKGFGRTPAVAALDLAIPEATTTCLLGPNGAGKTTIVRILSTLLRPDAGWARVAGHDVVTSGAAVRREIGLSGQIASVDELLTGRANLVMIAQLGRRRRGQAKLRAAELLAQFGMEAAADRPVRSYSGGMRRRIDLAASLINKPRVLFLDEPTTGLDPPSRQMLWALIRGLVVEGTTVLLTTQYLDEADRLADRICVMEDGRITAEGTPAELKARVGGAWLELTLSGPDLQAAPPILADHAAGPVDRAGGPYRLRVPVCPRPGLITDVITDLAVAGIRVDDAAIRQPSLQDVFQASTGREKTAA